MSESVVQTKRRVFTPSRDDHQTEQHSGPKPYVSKRKRGNNSDNVERNKKQRLDVIPTPLLSSSNPQEEISPALLAVRTRLSERRATKVVERKPTPEVKSPLFSTAKVARGISAEELRKSQNSTYQALLGRQKKAKHSGLT